MFVSQALDISFKTPSEGFEPECKRLRQTWTFLVLQAELQLETVSEMAPLREVVAPPSKDEIVEAILKALQHPTQPPKRDQPITLGKGKRVSLEGKLSNVCQRGTVLITHLLIACCIQQQGVC